MKKNYLHYLLLLQKAWNELINPCVNHTGSLRFDGRIRDYSCSAGKPGHEKCLHLIRTVKIGQKSASGSHFPWTLCIGKQIQNAEGNSPTPSPPVGPLQAHLALVLCFYRMVD